MKRTVNWPRLGGTQHTCPSCGVPTLFVRHGQAMAMPDTHCRHCQDRQRRHYEHLRVEREEASPESLEDFCNHVLQDALVGLELYLRDRRSKDSLAEKVRIHRSNLGRNMFR